MKSIFGASFGGQRKQVIHRGNKTFELGQEKQERSSSLSIKSRAREKPEGKSGENSVALRMKFSAKKEKKKRLGSSMSNREKANGKEKSEKKEKRDGIRDFR